MFKKAIKEESKLRLAIAGPSGSGKTYTALSIASKLGGSVAVVDTEHGSASKYADLFGFDVAEMHAPYHPEKYIKAIKAAADAGYSVIILDSMSHAWNGEGGLLELVEQATKRQKTPNSYTAWKDVTPIQNRLIEAIVSSPIHLIATMRSKQEYVQDRDNNGKSTIRKVGMAPVQREGFEYEFDVFLDMDVDNNAIVSKTRCSALAGKVIDKPGAQVAKILSDWLKSGAAPKTEQALTVEQDSDSTLWGEDHPEEENPNVPTDDELAILSMWATPQDAQLWAVNAGSCVNDHEARNSFKKIVDDNGGKLTKENIAAVYLNFLRRQMEKLEQQPEPA